MKKLSNEENFWKKIYAVWGVNGNYDFSKTEYKPDNEQINVICKKHGLISVKCCNFKNGHGCKKCADEKRYEKTVKKFKEDVWLYRGDWFEIITEFKTMNNDKIGIMCKTCGGLFSTTPKTFLKSKTCPLCENKSKKLTHKEFVEKINKIYNNSLTCLTKFKTVRDEVTCKCICGNVINKKAELFLLGSKCQACGDIPNKPITKKTFIEKAKKIHDNKYDYSLVDYKDLYTKVDIKCNKCKSVFSQRPFHHLYYESGCVKCNLSKGEETIASILEDIGYVLGETYFRQYIFKDLRSGKGKSDYLKLDFYIPKKNLAIEFQGEQHYKSVEIWGGEEAFKQRQKYDQIKRDYCKNNGISLLEIPYTDFKNIEKNYRSSFE